MRMLFISKRFKVNYNCSLKYYLLFTLKIISFLDTPNFFREKLLSTNEENLRIFHASYIWHKKNGKKKKKECKKCST